MIELYAAVLGMIATAFASGYLVWRHMRRVIDISPDVSEIYRQRQVLPVQENSRPADDTVLVDWDTLLSIAPAWVWHTDDKHAFNLVQGDILKRTGITGGAMLGHRPWRLSWQVLPPMDWEAYRGMVAARKPVRIIVEITADDEDQKTRIFELAGLPRYHEGKFEGYQGVAHDVTRRVRLSLSLKESRLRYQEIIDSMREAVFRTDGAGYVTALNPAWTQLTGRSAKSSLGKLFLSFVHHDDRHTLGRQMHNLIQARSTQFVDEFRLKSGRQKIRWVEATFWRIDEEGDPADGTADGEMKGGRTAKIGLAGTISDITPRKVAEMTLRHVNQELESRVSVRTAELEASNQELEGFSYSVSHDLRAPLRSIDGFARILQEDLGDRLTPEISAHLERICAATRRMSELIDSLIEMARLTRQALRKEDVNLSAMATQIINEIRLDDPTRKVEITIDDNIVVGCDRVLIRMVLENLLRNAWKFTSGREITLISFTRAEDKDSNHVFCVSDNGVGFDMAFSNKLFRPFHRLHDADSFAGSGIGLANVKKIIERHGGRVWAESVPEQYARFYFALPG